MLPGLCSFPASAWCLPAPIFRPGMASAAPFPTLLVLHARVTVQMIALSERGQSTERIMQLSQGWCTLSKHCMSGRKFTCRGTGGGGHAKCIECHRIHGSGGGRLFHPQLSATAVVSSSVNCILPSQCQSVTKKILDEM